MKALLNSLREKPWHVQIALLLTGVWAAWLFAWIVWAATIPEWHKPAANDEVAFGYTVWMVMTYIVVVAGLFAAFLEPGWGAIGGGLLVTLVAQWASRMEVDNLRHWGPGDLGFPRFGGHVTVRQPLLVVH